MSAEVGKRLVESNARLRPAGPALRRPALVVDIIASFGDHDEMLRGLKSQVFTQRSVKFRAIVDGQPAVREI